MTREEAIGIISGDVLGTTKQTHEAVAMAVEALSAQSQQVTGKLNSDCISRRDAIDAFKKELTVGESKGNYVTICSAVGYEGARQILENLPSAQRKGKWLEKKVIPVYENGFPLQSCKCSECDRYDTRPYMYYFSEPNFCSYCGAEMKGESDGEVH